MKENVLKQMIAVVDTMVKSNRSDFYTFDLPALLSERTTPEFFWSVRETGTELLIVDAERMLRRLRGNESARFAFMRHPEQVPNNFLCLPAAKTFHYMNGVLKEITNPADAVCDVWNRVSAYLQCVITMRFGDMEREYWHANMRVRFSSRDVLRQFYRAVHSDGGESLLQILRGFKRFGRGAVDEEVVIGRDWVSNDFSFCHNRNGECIMNGGILFYNGKWHSHT